MYGVGTNVRTEQATMSATEAHVPDAARTGSRRRCSKDGKPRKNPSAVLTFTCEKP
jgi:hypothetical protein